MAGHHRAGSFNPWHPAATRVVGTASIDLPVLIHRFQALALDGNLQPAGLLASIGSELDFLGTTDSHGKTTSTTEKVQSWETSGQ